jgi:peptidoglycan/LPS O-acetylase OafA/YrhL
MKLVIFEYLRFVLAVSVVIYHLPLFGFKKISYLGDSGSLAVLTFMCLSGFVLWRSSASATSAKRFILKRFFRLYPLHLVSLILTVFVSTIFQSPYREFDLFHLFLHLGLLHGLGIESWGTLNAPSWAVSTEFICSLLVAKLFVRQHSFKRRLAYIFVGIWFYQWSIVDSRISLCLIALLFGTLVSDVSSETNICKRRYFALFYFFVLTYFITVVAIRLMLSRVNYKLPFSDFLYESNLVTLTLIGCFLYIISKIGISSNTIMVVGKKLGGVAYGMYLFHIPVLIVITSIYPTPDVWAFVQIIIVLAILTLFSHRFIEIAIMDWYRTDGEELVSGLRALLVKSLKSRLSSWKRKF